MATFADLGISKDLIKGLKELNIVNPTPIQEQAIPQLLNSNADFIGQAQTGTGKTAAYGLPILQKVNPQSNKVQALILCPTRELGQQIAKQLFKFTKYSDKIFTEAVYGGAQIDPQIRALKRPTQIIVATPGRLIDLIERKAVNLDFVKHVVLDEADEMLSMGFKKELSRILRQINERTTWLFSATMPKEMESLIEDHMATDAHRVQVDSKNVVNKDIEHQFLVCNQDDKLNVLTQFLKVQHNNRGVIFCKTKKEAQLLAKRMIAKNYATDAIHGDLLQKERDKVMRAFKNESLQILIATDLAARGIDVQDLAYVVHWQLPDQLEYYTHRSGRTARAGKKGVSLSIITPPERKNLRHIEAKLGILMNEIRR